MSSYDLLVIGGGINGLAIAADAAARGLSTLVAERGDFGEGTTSASSRLIHGGLRYLEHGEFSLVQESLRERGLLARRRPHLVRPIQLLIPTFRGAPPPRWKLAAGLGLYDLFARDPLFPRSRMLSKAQVRSREVGIANEALTGGFLYPDAQLEFPERLCVELVREAQAAGGVTLNHTRVTRLRTEGRRVTGAALRDELTGREWEVEASLVINAAGPWVDVVNRLLPEPPPPLIGGTWGTHLVLPVRAGSPQGPIYTAARSDNRPIFLLPWDGRLLVGTTDRLVKVDDPDQVRMEADEPGYLLRETNLLFPACEYTESDIQFTTIGVRPLPRSEPGRKAGAITRRHFLVDHAARHGVQGLASVVGGKLTTHRSLAEEVVDWAAQTLGREGSLRRCATADAVQGPSLEVMEQVATQAVSALGLPAEGGPRLARIYGPHLEEVLAHIRRDPALGSPLVAGCPALRAEVPHATEVEGARTAEDVVLRRLMLMPPHPGSVDAAAALFPAVVTHR